MSAPEENLQNTVIQLEKTLSEKDRIIHEQARRIALLEEYLRLEKLRKFAARSEKLATSLQGELFNEAELVDAVTEIEPTLAPEKASIATDTPVKRGRKPLPADLPRVRIEHDVPASHKRCACGGERECIGEDTREQLDIIPARVRVLVHARKKYACRQCEGNIQIAALPAHPIPKSNASPGTLAHVAVSKYQDALPLYRQEVMLERIGVEIPRNTLAHWMIRCGALIQPLINVLQDHLLSYPVLHCDETPLQVLNEQDKVTASKSWMWVRVGGPPTQPIRLFHYADTRAGAVARELLTGYQGYLQTDDYAAYNAVCAESSIIPLGCWAHARRKFVEAQKAAHSPSGKMSKAERGIQLIGKLYAIEKCIADKDIDTRYLMRQQEAVPQLKKIREWLDTSLHNTLPKGLLGKALGYLDKNWEKLIRYVDDGRLAIDNNAAENAIRPFVVGRKNWLFSSSVNGAKASANLYSLIETAKVNGLEPYAYLRHVFTQLPTVQSVAQIEDLLPWCVDLQGGDY